MVVLAVRSAKRCLLAVSEGLVMTTSAGRLANISPYHIQKNPNNPRRYFNDERLDLLRTSIQEVGVLVPLIVYRSPDHSDEYVLMDGERRWRCAVDLGMESVPANVIATPNPLDNLLRMFNIHNVREDWPLISVALSLREVMQISDESGEKRLSAMTGLTRSTVRRAKRLLSIPDNELVLIQEEAHLDRNSQIHREDLYLEIEAAESVMRTELPEMADRHPREDIIRQFARKAEEGTLPAVTDFRFVGKLVKAIDDDVVDRATVVRAAEKLIADVSVSPREIFQAVAADGYQQQNLQRKIELLSGELNEIRLDLGISEGLRTQLRSLRDKISYVLKDL